jgi:hypothetical protein
MTQAPACGNQTEGRGLKMKAPEIVFTQHAEDMLVERRLDRAWIELTITMPESVEPDPDSEGVLRAPSGAFLSVTAAGCAWFTFEPAIK